MKSKGISQRPEILALTDAERERLAALLEAWAAELRRGLVRGRLRAGFRRRLALVWSPRGRAGLN
jgi:hypothetical protein